MKSLSALASFSAFVVALAVAPRALAADPPALPAPDKPAGLRDADPPRVPFTPLPAAGQPAAPTSESGTGLAAPSAAPAPPASDDARTQARADALERRLSELEAKVRTEEAERAKAPSSMLKGLSLQFYVQPQFLTVVTNAAGSVNGGNGGLLPPGVRSFGGTGALPTGIQPNDLTARADGSTTNTTFFRLRRTRLKAVFEPAAWVRGTLVLDAYPIGSGTTFARDIIATGIVHWSDDVVTELNAGMFKVPISYELTQSSRDRPFVERSAGTRVMFPGERDIGVWIHTSALKKRLQTDLAVINGLTQGEPTFSSLPDLDRGKDLVLHANYNFGPADLGAGFYAGTGQRVDVKDLRFRSFRRWAVRAEGGVHHTFVKALGETRLLGELTFSQNMDRGTTYAFDVAASPTNPAVTPRDLPERAFFVRLEQDLGRYLFAGLRFDQYAPDTSMTDNAVSSTDLLLGVNLGPKMRVGAEYIYVLDDVHAPGANPVGREFHIVSTYVQIRYDP
jgi:hypothetical protein